MAFGELGLAKKIIQAAPKYTKIVEPFAQYGTLALYLAKKKPKEHIVNIEDETTFAIMSFMQALSAANKRRLKQYDWVAAPETFDSILKISATEGADLFYRFFYLKKFGVRSKDPEVPPTFDYLKRGHDMKSMLYTLPVARIGLKGATLTNDEPISVMSQAAGAFMVLLPKTPEQIDAVEAKLGSLGGDFFYAKKSMDNTQLFESVDKNSGPKMIISTVAASSIMMATMEVRTNYPGKLEQIEPIK